MAFGRSDLFSACDVLKRSAVLTRRRAHGAIDAEVSFEQYHKPTCRERFLDEMNRIVPWADLTAAIEPFYPKAEGPGRPPVGVERILRLHCLHQWFNLSDRPVEEALYDSRTLRHFVGIDLGREPVPDGNHDLQVSPSAGSPPVGRDLFARIREYLAAQGLQVSRGTIVDATIIAAPSSTKNGQEERDPEMHQTKKGTSGISAWGPLSEWIAEPS